LFDHLPGGDGFRGIGEARDGEPVEGGGELVLELGELPASGGEGIPAAGLDAQQGAIAEAQFGGLRDDAGLTGGERLAVEEDGLRLQLALEVVAVACEPRLTAPPKVLAPEIVWAVVRVRNAPLPAMASTVVAVPPAPPEPLP
jgi:hypothetical protein